MFDCDCDDQMFLLGDALLVAPVVTAGAFTRTAVLPAGSWIDRSTGDAVTSDGHAPITVSATLDVIPTWQRASTLLPTYANVADTLLPATAAGVTSYADPAIGGELRVDYAAGDVATLALYDGTQLSCDGTSLEIIGGSEYQLATFALQHDTVDSVTTDGSLLSAGDVTSCGAPGCWSFTPSTKQLLVRLYAPSGSTRSAVVH